MLHTMVVTKIDFKCIFGDIMCLGGEHAANGMATHITDGLKFFLGGGLDVMMFTGDGVSKVGEFSINALGRQFNLYMGIMLSILGLVLIVQAIVSMITNNWHRIGMSVIAVLFSVPMMWLMIRFVQITITACNTVTKTLLGESTDGFAVAIGTLFASSRWISNMGWVLGLLMVGLMWVGVMIFAVIMMGRNFLLLALMTVAPVGLLFMGQPKLGVWTRRYMDTLLVTIFAQPAMAAIIAVAGGVMSGVAGSTPAATGLTGGGGSGGWVVMTTVRFAPEAPDSIGGKQFVVYLMGLVGLFVSLFAPFLLGKLFHWASGEIGDAMQSRTVGSVEKGAAQMKRVAVAVASGGTSAAGSMSMAAGQAAGRKLAAARTARTARTTPGSSDSPGDSGSGALTQSVNAPSPQASPSSSPRSSSRSRSSSERVPRPAPAAPLPPVPSSPPLPTPPPAPRPSPRPTPVPSPPPVPSSPPLPTPPPAPSPTPPRSVPPPSRPL